MTRAMEYFSDVSQDLFKAKDKGLKIRILMRSNESLNESDVKKRDQNIGLIKEILGESVSINVSNEVPLRGCIIDPKGEGRALFLVEEEGVPYLLREAAITSHPGVVKSLASMFELQWEFDSKKIVQSVHDAGIVGLGGAAFPTHVKLTLNEKKPIDTLLVNGCECEPYLTADYRLT